jgi:hypothetical protein
MFANTRQPSVAFSSLPHGDEKKEVVARSYYKGIKLEPGTSMNM